MAEKMGNIDLKIHNNIKGNDKKEKKKVRNTTKCYNIFVTLLFSTVVCRNLIFYYFYLREINNTIITKIMKQFGGVLITS